MHDRAKPVAPLARRDFRRLSAELMRRRERLYLALQLA